MFYVGLVMFALGAYAYVYVVARVARWLVERIRADERRRCEEVWEAKFRIWAANDLSYRLSRDGRASGYAVSVEESSQGGAYYVRPCSPGLGDDSAPRVKVPWTSVWSKIHDQVQP